MHTQGKKNYIMVTLEIEMVINLKYIAKVFMSYLRERVAYA